MLNYKDDGRPIEEFTKKHFRVMVLADNQAWNVTDFIYATKEQARRGAVDVTKGGGLAWIMEGVEMIHDLGATLSIVDPEPWE